MKLPEPELADHARDRRVAAAERLWRAEHRVRMAIAFESLPSRGDPIERAEAELELAQASIAYAASSGNSRTNSMNDMRESEEFARTGFCLSAGGILYPSLYRRRRTDTKSPGGLDPGIAAYVDALREAGIETFESCQGGLGHAYPEPTIRFHGHRDEGFRALAAALARGLPVLDLRRTWPVLDGEPTGPYWELTFYLPSELSRAQ